MDPPRPGSFPVLVGGETGASAAGAAGPIREVVCYAKRSKRPINRYDWTPAVRLVALLALAFAGFILVELVGSRIGISRLAGFLALLSALLLTHFATAVRSRGFRRALKKNPYDEPKPDARLWCVGLPDQIARHGDFPDMPFEPFLANAFLAHKFNARMCVTWLLAFLAAFALMHFLIERELNWDILHLPAHKVWTAGVFAAVGVAWLWPSYFRIVPGRLDIIRFSTFRDRVVSCQRVDLRCAEILVDFHRNVVFVDDQWRKHEFMIALMPGRTRFAHALFWAAMNTHTPPDLPEDRLLG